jgi:hypothetical protein
MNELRHQDCPYNCRPLLEIPVLCIILSYSGLLSVSVRNHGETCFHDVQCVGSGILCKANETDRSVKYCYCNRYSVECYIISFGSAHY